jgi:hypothetical protein
MVMVAILIQSSASLSDFERCVNTTAALLVPRLLTQPGRCVLAGLFPDEVFERLLECRVGQVFPNQFSIGGGIQLSGLALLVCDLVENSLCFIGCHGCDLLFQSSALCRGFELAPRRVAALLVSLVSSVVAVPLPVFDSLTLAPGFASGDLLGYYPAWFTRLPVSSWRSAWSFGLGFQGALLLSTNYIITQLYTFVTSSFRLLP